MTGTAPISREDMAPLIKELEIQMKTAARNLEFEKAALLRDRIIELRREAAAIGRETARGRRDWGKRRPGPGPPAAPSAGAPAAHATPGAAKEPAGGLSKATAK